MASPSPLARASKEELLARYEQRSAEFDAIARRRARFAAPEARPLTTAAESQAARSAQLSDRELEVIDLIANGLTNGEIGNRLFLSEETVKSHLRNVLAKLGAKNRAHAVALAFRGGAIS